MRPNGKANHAERDTFVDRLPILRADTVHWKEEDRAPAIVDQRPEDSKHAAHGSVDKILPSENPLWSDVGRPIKILLALPVEPVSAKGKADARQSRFLQFYAGLRMALEDADAQQHHFELKVAEADKLTVQALGAPGDSFPDILIGPYVRDTLELWLNAMAGHHAIVVSPWLPAFPPKEPRPQFIQLIPGLERHAEVIMNYIRDQFAGQRVVLVARADSVERARLKVFQQFADPEARELIVADKSTALESLSLKGYLEDRGTVFVMPFYSRQDETFVNTFLGKLESARGKRPVTVFGLPQWIGFANLNPIYLEALSVHLTQPAWPMADPDAISQFRKKFFARHAIVPDISALQGYDMGRWLVETVDKGGRTALFDETLQWENGLSSGFSIKAVHPRDGDTTDVRWYENASLRIVRFLDQDFTGIR